MIPELAYHFWQRPGPRWGAWWIPDEAPGGLGAPEVWIDEAALDMYGRGDAAPAVTVTGGRGYDHPGGNWWSGAVIRFEKYPGLSERVVYSVKTRRFGPENLGRPYYVLRWPD